MLLFFHIVSQLLYPNNKCVLDVFEMRWVCYLFEFIVVKADRKCVGYKLWWLGKLGLCTWQKHIGSLHKPLVLTLALYFHVCMWSSDANSGVFFAANLSFPRGRYSFIVNSTPFGLALPLQPCYEVCTWNTRGCVSLQRPTTSRG